MDRALLDRMRSGDEGALATFYDRWCDRVHSLALHLLRDGRDAEDIVEETFWQAWRGAAQKTVDDAQVRYFIVHLHRLLDPGTGAARA